MRGWLAICCVLGVSACGDPLSGVGRLAQVDAVSGDVAVAALPDAQEIAREGFPQTDANSALAQAEPVAPPAEPLPAGGFLRGLLQRAAAADPAAAIAADVARAQSQTPVEADTTVEEKVELAALPAPDVAGDAPVDDVVQDSPRRGGFGLFGRKAARAETATAAPEPRRGPDARDVPFGTVLAFGEIARVCEAKGKSLGRKVDGAGRRGFTLYDSDAGALAKRTFYITGFSDDCPRQFTAANALFGAPSFYEQIRFGPAGANLPYANTDKAYDKVKSSVCGASKGKPCGAKIDQMDSQTAFVSAYEFYESSSQWKEFLVHDGVVLAGAVKSLN